MESLQFYYLLLLLLLLLHFLVCNVESYASSAPLTQSTLLHLAPCQSLLHPHRERKQEGGWERTE